jgi:hypothetical protein
MALSDSVVVGLAFPEFQHRTYRSIISNSVGKF